jgi:hypothetical protein
VSLSFFFFFNTFPEDPSRRYVIILAILSSTEPSTLTVTISCKGKKITEKEKSQEIQHVHDHHVAIIPLEQGNQLCSYEELLEYHW